MNTPTSILIAAVLLCAAILLDGHLDRTTANADIDECIEQTKIIRGVDELTPEQHAMYWMNCHGRD